MPLRVLILDVARCALNELLQLVHHLRRSAPFGRWLRLRSVDFESRLWRRDTNHVTDIVKVWFGGRSMYSIDLHGLMKRFPIHVRARFPLVCLLGHIFHEMFFHGWESRILKVIDPILAC